MSGDTRDVKDFEFQQLCKIRLFKAPNSILKQRTGLLASSSKYGLCFAGFGNNLLVFRTIEILRLDEERGMEKRSQTIIEDFPVLKNLTLSGHIVNIAISCDDLTLLVVMEVGTNIQLLFFDVRSFCLPTECGPFLMHHIEAGNQILDLAWNPTTPELLALCLSTGIVKMLHVSAEVKAVNLPGIGATCLCWSPKGKQVVIGTQQGELKQYSPALELKKNWPHPNNVETRVKVLDVVWVSTYMFIAAYEAPNAVDQPIVQIVNVPKDAPPSFINYRDPCYGSSEDRHNKFFFHLLLKWDLVILASSNSLEAAIMAKNLDTEKSWEHWMLEDSARAEVPLTADKSDSFPMGVTIDYSSPKQIVVNDTETIGPFPLMMILSTDGVLVPFHMVYRHKLAVPLTGNAENLGTAGIRPSLPGLIVPCGPLLVPGSSADSLTTTSAPEGFPSLQFDAKLAAPIPSPIATPAAKPQMTGLPSGTGLSFGSGTARNIFGGQVASPPEPLGQQAPAFNFTGPPLQAKAPANWSGSTSLPATSKTEFNFTPDPTAATVGSTAATVGSTAATVGSTAADTTKNMFGAPAQPKFNFAGAPSLTGSLPATTPAFNFTPGSKGFGSLSTGTAVATTAPPASVTVAPRVVPATVVTKPTAFGTAMPADSSQAVLGAGAAAVGSQGFGAAAASGASSFNFNFAKAPAAQVAKAPEGNRLPGVTRTELSVPQVAPVAAKPQPHFPVKPVTVTQKPTKRNESGGHVTSSEAPSPAVDPKQQSSINETVDSTFVKSIMEEICHFKQELEHLKLRGKSCQAFVGNEEEKRELRLKTEKIQAFSDEIMKTTMVQQKEIADQKLSLFDLFHMLEECRIKDERNNDVRYHKLLRAQCLDPASAEIMNTLHQMQQVVTNGLSDTNVVLDQQWEDFQNQYNKKGRKIRPSGMDTVYQVIKKNQNIINGQKSVVKCISTQLKDMHLYKKDSWTYDNIPTIKPGVSELSSLADTLIASDSRQSTEVISPKVVVISPLKQTKLREHLSKRSVSIVKPESPGSAVSRLRLKDIPKLNLDEEISTPKSSPAANSKEGQQLQSSGPDLMTPHITGLKRGLLPNSVLSTTDVGAGFFTSGQQISLDASTPLKTDQKSAPKEGFFPLTMTTPNYASGLNLEDVTPTCSVSGEEEWYPGEEEEEEDDDEEEYPYDEEGVEEIAQEIPESQETAPPAISASVPTFNFTDPKTASFAFGAKSGFSFPTVTMSPLTSNTASSPLVSTPVAKSNLFGTPTSTAPSQNILATADPPKGGQLDAPGVSSRLGLLATPTTTTSSSFGVSKSLFTNPSSSTGFNFSLDTASKPVEPTPPDAPAVPLSSETQPTASLPANEKPAGVVSLAQPETASGPPSSSPATVSSLDQTVITSTIAATAAEVSKPNVTFSFAPSSQPGSSPFATQSMFKNPISASAAAPSPAGLFQSPQISSTTIGSSPATGLFQSPAAASTTAASSPATGLFQSPATASTTAASSPAAGLFTIPPSTNSGMFFKPPPATATTAATPIASSTPPPAYKPSIAAGTAASASVGVPSPDPASTATTPSTSALGTLLSAPVSTKGEGLLQSLAGESSTSGTPATAAATTGLVFSPPATATSSIVFGQPSSTPSSPLVTELFKPQTQTPATASTGLFGQSTSTGINDLFGKMGSSTSGKGLFSHAGPTGTSLFGQATVSSASSIISGSSGTPASAVFGTTKSVFGNAPAGSPFGATPSSPAAQPATASPFGAASSSPATQPATGSPFGAAPSSTATQPAATSASPFGQSSISGFGQATSTAAFGKPAFGQSAFGQSSEGFQTTSAFGQSSTPSPGSVFAQASAPGTSVFGQPSSSAGGGGVSGVFGNANPSATTASAPSGSAGLFGSSSPFFSGLGGKPSQENADKNVFGSTNQVFGQAAAPTTAANLFGGQPPASSGFKSVSLASPKLNTSSFGFGSTAAGSSGGASSSATPAGSSVAASGFGVAQQQQQQQQQPQSQSPGAFGANPAFGLPSAFGGSPTFGNKPAFGFGGSTSTFGSNVPSFSSPFGSGAGGGAGAQTASVFGQSSSPAQTASASGFANFAQSSSPTFGSLAQTSPGFGQQQTSGFGAGGGGGGGGGFGSPPAAAPAFGSNSGSGFGSGGSAFGHSASFTGYRS